MILQNNERFDRLIKEKIDIIQSKDVFSFSLDAVLLADFVTFAKRKNYSVIDACSGNGVIAFLLSHKLNHKIYAIEYQEQLVNMAQRTIIHNHLEEKVEMLHMDFKDATQYFKKDSVDVITCNPPYFPIHDKSLQNEQTTYALARHEIALTLDDWVKTSADLLKMKGKLFCVHRPERLTSIITTMEKYNLYVKKLRFVRPFENSLANIVLIEAIKYGKPDGVIVLPDIIVFDEHKQYTPYVHEVLYGE